jgi:hypothetical protein
MGLSRDGRIGIAFGVLVSIALVLIKPEQTAWRLALLICFGICMLYVAKELDWVNQRDVELSIVHGPIDSQSRSAVRLGFALLAAVLVTVVLGKITWPTRQSTPIPPSVNTTTGPQSPIMPNNSGDVTISNDGGSKPKEPTPKDKPK